MAGVRALNIPVAELRDDPKATMRYLSKLCQKAVEEDRADTLVLGCLGLAEYGDALEQEFGVKSLTRFPGAGLGGDGCPPEPAAIQTFLWACKHTGGSMSRINDCLDLLRQLVSIPSESQNEEAHARFLETYLRDELGDGNTANSCRGEKLQCERTLAPGAGECPAQTDVGRAFGYGEPHRPLEDRSLPFGAAGRPAARTGCGRYEGGPGSPAHGLEILKEQGFLWDAEVEFVGLADEERHSVGANDYVRRILEEKQPRPETFFIMAEPHLTTLL
mgnify:CR=1 FL=1